MAGIFLKDEKDVVLVLEEFSDSWKGKARQSGVVNLGSSKSRPSGSCPLVPAQSSGCCCSGLGLGCSKEIFPQMGGEAQPRELEACPHKRHQQPQGNHELTRGSPKLSLLPPIPSSTPPRPSRLEAPTSRGYLRGLPWSRPLTQDPRGSSKSQW